MTDGRPLLEAHLNGEELSDKQCAALSAWVCASPDNAALAAELTHLNESIAQNTKAKSLGSLLDTQETELFQDAFDQDEPGGAGQEAELPPIHIDSAALTKQKYLSALSYVLSHTFTPKRLITGAAAAVLLLGALLAIVLMSGPDTPEEIAIQPTEEPGTHDAVAPIVATITATQNAVWSGPQPAGDLRRGSRLHPNDRLTLTAGFAEITTSRGAVAILEAPATVELLDNANALRLHTGRLVGICETESSKGFLVRTPHMDVTDLGTRFGIDASAPSATELHVFDGEVQAIRTDSPVAGQPMLIVTGQSVSTAADDDTFSMSYADARRFGTVQPKITRLPGSGVGVAQNSPDPNWSVVAVDRMPLANPIALLQRGTSGGVALTPDDPAVAQWLGLVDTQSIQADQDVVYTIQTTIDVPQSVDLDKAHLRLSLHVDDRLEQMVINGRPVAALEQAEEQARQRGTHLLPNSGLALRHGTNTIEFHVLNIASTPLHLHIAWELEQPQTTDFFD